MDFESNIDAGKKATDTKDIEACRSRVAAMPGDPKAWFELGLGLQAAGRTAEALVAYDRAAELAPNNAVVLNNRGLALNALQRHEAAIEDFRRAAALAPNLADPHFNLGNLLAALDRRSEAIAAFRAAVALQRSFTAAWHNLGDSLQATGDLDGALQAYREALRCDPGAFARIVNSLAAHARGRLWLDLAELRRSLTS